VSPPAVGAAYASAQAGAYAPACYDVRVTHHRREPVDYRFTNRAKMWLVDLDALPRLPRGLGWLCRFDSRDHLGERSATIRANLDRWLERAGAPVPARVLMLACPRLLGYVFNPLTVFYCYDLSGRLRHVVAEVRNTYGGLHCYLLTPDGAGRAGADKAFYVSPFHPATGRYDLRVPEPRERLAVAVTLRRPDAAVFTAAMTGRRSMSSSLWTALRVPLASRAVALSIRRHGITLYAKGLRPFPREEASQ